MNSRFLIPSLTGFLGLVVGLALGLAFGGHQQGKPEATAAVVQKPSGREISETLNSLSVSVPGVPVSARAVNAQFPERAAKALQVSSIDLRNAEVVELVREWAVADKASASAWALALPTGAVRSTAIRAYAETIARSDAPAAMAFLSQHLEEGPGSGAYHNIISEWARQDPAGALGWATSAGTEGQILAAVALSNVPEESFAKTVSFVDQMPASPLRVQLQTRLATTWASRDRAAALGWAERLPPGSREPALEAIAAQIGSEDPAAAAALVGKMNGDAKASAIAVLAGQWGHADPRAASKWLLSLGKESDLRGGAETLAGAWAKQNSNEAAQWIDSLPPGGIRDAAVARFVGIISAWDPESAVVYAQTISDPGERTSLVANLEARLRKAKGRK